MNKLILTMTILLCLSFAVDAKKLYKWVDENGQVHYSDSVPVDQIKKEHEELNSQGVVLEKVENARTKEEYQAMKEEKLRQIELEKVAAEEQRVRDNIIKSYTNESEITRLRDERLAALKRNIELAHQSLEFQNESKEQLLAMAADQERNGKDISKALQSRITTIEEKIEYQMEFIKVKEKEIKNVNDKFDSDMTIYREAIGHKSNKKE